MTTIAWDGKILAVDSQCVASDIIINNNEQKLFLDVGPYKAVAISGSLQEMILFIRWLDRRDNTDQPELREGGVAVCVCENGALYTYFSQHKGNPQPHHGIFTAGTGCEIALGAMEAGANAIKAVEIACKRDIYTGGKVHHYNHNFQF